jgi:outer membrane protein W
MRARNVFATIALGIATFISTVTFAQTPMGSTPSQSQPDSAIIFEPSQPLVQSRADLAKEYPNTWGFNASFSDYGFGGGLFLGHNFSQDFEAQISAEMSTASASREFDLVTDNKVNRVFVIPIMLSGQYRLFSQGLSDNLRPYVTAGAGAVVAMTTPFQEDFFTAFADQQSKIVPGGFIGLGAKFGMDPKSTFGASLRYFIIPYPGAIQSTSSQSLTNLSALYLSVSYGMNF